MIQNIKDRVPVNVLSNDAIRYGIYDEEGNLVRYEYIKREDEPVEVGTSINKALLDNLQGDLYTVDRYNKSVVTYEAVGRSVANVDIIPSSWTKISDTEYIGESDLVGDIVLTSDSAVTNSNFALNKIADKDVSSAWNSDSNTNTGSANHWAKIKFANPIKITKMKTYIIGSSSSFANAIIQGSNNDSQWNDLYTISSQQTELTEIILNNPNYYQYYRIYGTITRDSAVFGVYEWQISEFEGDLLGYVNNLSLPLTSYEVGKIVNIEAQSTDVYRDDTVQATNIFPTSGWTDISTGNASNKTLYTKYTSNDYILESSTSRVEGEGANNACDNSSSGWNSKGTTEQEWIKMTCPAPTKITKMSTWVTAYGNTSGFKKAVIQGSKDDSNWVNLSTLSTYQTEKTELALENTDYYTYYRIVVDISYFNANVGACVKYWEVAEWIEGSHIETIASFENPYLNINNLGAKQINGTIVAGRKYSLVYNGESWNIINNYVTGTYTGNAKTWETADYYQTIELGVTPYMVIVFVAYSSPYAYASTYYSVAIANLGMLAKTGVRIIENGFEVWGSGYQETTESMNNPAKQYGYIAFF